MDWVCDFMWVARSRGNRSGPLPGTFWCVYSHNSLCWQQDYVLDFDVVVVSMCVVNSASGSTAGSPQPDKFLQNMNKSKGGWLLFFLPKNVLSSNFPVSQEQQASQIWGLWKYQTYWPPTDWNQREMVHLRGINHKIENNASKDDHFWHNVWRVTHGFFSWSFFFRDHYFWYMPLYMTKQTNGQNSRQGWGQKPMVNTVIIFVHDWYP